MTIELVESFRYGSRHARSKRTFNGLFWGVIHTYTGHTSESLNQLLVGGAELCNSLQSGSAHAHRAVCPRVPSILAGKSIIPSAVPMEDLPPVECCEDAAAIVRLRDMCFRYGESITQLLELTHKFSDRWGRLTLSERELLRKAIQSEISLQFTENDLRACFSDVRFTQKELNTLTPDLMSFTNLTTLVLSNNPQLTSVLYIPPSCLVLVASGCSIREVCPSKSLVVLGLSYNRVEQLDFLDDMPALRVLDLTRNAIFSMEATIEAIQRHKSLTDATFIGCPISLLNNYSERLVSDCPRLQRFDHAVPPRSIALPIIAPPAPPAAVASPSISTSIALLPPIDGTQVIIGMELKQMEGLGSLSHVPVLREDLSNTARSEQKVTKGKKKTKTAIIGPAYDFTTKITLRGAWGGVNGAMIACEGLRLESAAANAMPPSVRRKTQAAPPPIEDVRVLNERVAAALPSAPDLAEALAEPLALHIEICDDICFPSGRCATLSCDMGAFFFDASELLRRPAPLPRCATVSSTLQLNTAAIEETRLRAQEFRDGASAALVNVSLITSRLSEVALPALTGASVSTGATKKRGRSVAHRNTAGTEPNWAELLRKREEEVEESNLLASVAERRAEELQRLHLTATINFTLGCEPKPAQEEVANDKNARKAKGTKVKR